MKIMNRLHWFSALAAAGALTLAGCGGGSGGVANLDDPSPIGDDGAGDAPVAVCDPSDADTFDSCGVGVVTVTDADGDVLSFAVDIVSLELERSGGDVIQTLPGTTRIDFADYVELSELLGAPRLPPGNYVRGAMTLDFSNAEVVVEQDGEAVMATVVDPQGEPITQTTIEVALTDQTQFTVGAGQAALLALDFDLESSNEIDTGVSPPVVTVQPVLLAEVNPIDEKELRVRGVLEAVDTTGNVYQVDVRPLGRGDGRFGDVPVRVTSETTYDIDGQLLTGADGLAALGAMPEDTLTVAFGVLSTSGDAAFTASSVLAGTSVPGIDGDTVVGTVVAREGDVLTVRGATVVRAGEQPTAFFDQVTVTVGLETQVSRPVDPIDGLTTTAISVGQQVRIFGVANVPVGDEGDDDDDGIEQGAPLILPPLELDATQGRVQLLRSQVSGIVADNQSGLLTLDLASLNTRGAPAFDFSGTGLSPALDADPAAYEIDTNGLAADAPVGGAARVFGYVNAFGQAPPDFAAFTTVQFEDLRTIFRLVFNPALADQAFVNVGPDAIALNVEALERSRIRVPGLRVPLGAPQILPMLVPADEPSRYGVVDQNGTEMFEDFAAFAEALALRLDGTTVVRSITAAGLYAPLATTLEARSIVVVLRAPSSVL